LLENSFQSGFSDDPQQVLHSLLETKNYPSLVSYILVIDTRRVGLANWHGIDLPLVTETSNS
jgi:hypothetical protein